MAVYYTFGNATAAIPLSQLDNNFATPITIGNVSAQLGNTVATIGNLTLTNVTITSGTIPSANLSSNNIVIGNTTAALGSTVSSIGNLTLANVTIQSVSSAITPAEGGTGLTSVGTSGNVLVSNGTAWLSQAPAASVSLSTNNTWTGTQTFNGTSSILGAVLLDSAETVNVVGSAPSSTTNFYIQSGSVQYYTTSAANNWTLNIAFSSGTSLNTALSTGQSITFTLITTQSSTAYYNNAVTIDGASVTPVWVNGAPSAGNASGNDVYRYAVIKTGSATYTVLASLTQYK